MKKTLQLVTLLLLLMVSSTFAQKKFELGGNIGWMFAGIASTYEGDLNIRNDVNWGFNAAVAVDRDMQVEFSYDRLDTKLTLKTYPDRVTTDLFKMAQEYYQVGGIRFIKRGKMRPYGLVTIGATRFAPVDSKYDDEWRFAFAFGGGLKYYVKDNIAIRLQGRIKVPVFWVSGGLWIGTGGPGYGISAGSMMAQVDLSAGINIGFGK